MITINRNLDSFFKELCATNYDNFSKLITKYEINEDLLIDYASWSNEKYQRVCLRKNEDCELILICWTSEQKTAIHNHSGQKCWVNVIKGTFKETIFDKKEDLSKQKTSLLTEGQTTFLSDDIGLHTLENVSDELGMSLHLYSKPISQCDIYDEKTGDHIGRSISNDVNLNVASSETLEVRNDLQHFINISTSLLEDEKSNPISERIPAGELKDKIDISLKEQPLIGEDYYQLLKQVVLATPKTSSKLFFNQLFGGRKSKAILGDLLAVMLNNSMYTYKVGGVQVGIEKEIIDKVIDMIGYGSKAGGTFPTGGSMSNFNAILMARDWKDNKSKQEGITKQLVAYTSQESHYSVEKNAAFIGLGRSNVRKIVSDEMGKMNVLALKEAICADIEAGMAPFFINATAGTTVLGAFDPFEDIAALAKEFGLWMHIDGAYSGSVIFSEKYKHLVSGISKSDSFSFNPHKMLGTPMTCSMLMVKDKQNLYASFSNEASYLYQTDEDDYNLGKISFQCGRRNDALKFWALWKSVGTTGLEKIVDHEFHLANVARDYVDSHPDYTLYSFENSVSICFNYKDIPANEICTKMYEDNTLMIGYGKFKEVEFIRLVTVNSTNSESDILNLFKVIESYG